MALDKDGTSKGFAFVEFENEVMISSNDLVTRSDPL